MILALNIGNTNITIGAIKGKTIVFQARLRTDPTKTSDEYAIDLKMLLSIRDIPTSEIDGAIVSSRISWWLALASKRGSIFALTIRPRPEQTWWWVVWQL